MNRDSRALRHLVDSQRGSISGDEPLNKGPELLARCLRGLPSACFRSRFDIAASAGFTLFWNVTDQADAWTANPI
jgi:hypothetical protein